MPGALQQLPDGAAVAVIRLRSLGDCVLTTPALHLIARARPDLRIAVAVEERFAPVFSGNPDVCEILQPSLREVRRWRPELCLNLHGGGRSLRLTALSGARLRAGFAHFRGSAIYNVRIPRAQEVLGVERKVHTAEHLASAAFFLGAPMSEIPRARLFAKPHCAKMPYAILHPAAALPEKTWPAEHFLALARHLRAQHGLDPIFVAGPGEDLGAFSEFRTIAGAPLEHTKSLIAGASLFAGNDSGPAHVAAAFGVPVVVMYGPSDPVVWAPWRTESEALVSRGGDASEIPLERAIDAVDRLRVAR